MSDKEKSNRGYEVGYGRPLKHSQFQPGKSGHPNGRPKKSKELNSLFRMELDKTIVVTEDGQQKRITKREAVITQVVNRAIKGVVKPLQIVIAYLQNNREIEPFVSTAADDEALLRALPDLKKTKEVDDGPA